MAIRVQISKGQGYNVGVPTGQAYFFITRKEREKVTPGRRALLKNVQYLYYAPPSLVGKDIRSLTDSEWNQISLVSRTEQGYAMRHPAGGSSGEGGVALISGGTGYTSSRREGDVIVTRELNQYTGEKGAVVTTTPVGQTIKIPEAPTPPSLVAPYTIEAYEKLTPKQKLEQAQYNVEVSKSTEKRTKEILAGASEMFAGPGGPKLGELTQYFISQGVDTEEAIVLAKSFREQAKTAESKYGIMSPTFTQTGIKEYEQVERIGGYLGSPGAEKQPWLTTLSLGVSGGVGKIFSIPEKVGKVVIESISGIHQEEFTTTIGKEVGKGAPAFLGQALIWSIPYAGPITFGAQLLGGILKPSPTGGSWLAYKGKQILGIPGEIKRSIKEEPGEFIGGTLGAIGGGLARAKGYGIGPRVQEGLITQELKNMFRKEIPRESIVESGIISGKDKFPTGFKSKEYLKAEFESGKYGLPSAEDRIVTLYHGTTKESAKLIKKEGLKPPSFTLKTKGVLPQTKKIKGITTPDIYTTTNPAIAKQYAKGLFSKQRGAIVKIDLLESQIKKSGAIVNKELETVVFSKNKIISPTQISILTEKQVSKIPTYKGKPLTEIQLTKLNKSIYGDNLLFKSGGYHATVEKLKPTVGVGSSELPGLYIAPSVSEYFLRVSSEAPTKIKLFGKRGSPKVAYIRPKEFKVTPSGTPKTIKEFLVSEAKQGYAYVPGAEQKISGMLKYEKEAILPPGTKLIKVSNEFKFRTTGGLAVGIDEYITAPTSATKGIKGFINKLSGKTKTAKQISESIYKPSEYVIFSPIKSLGYIWSAVGSSNTFKYDYAILKPSYTTSSITKSTISYPRVASSKVSSKGRTASGRSITSSIRSPIKPSRQYAKGGSPSFTSFSASSRGFVPSAPPTMSLGVGPTTRPEGTFFVARPLKREGKKTNQAFNVFVRESRPKGKSQIEWVKVNKQPLPENKAFNLGALYTDRTTAATFQLRPKGNTKLQDDNFREITAKFRSKRPKSKIRGFPTYIEKNKYRIDTPTELQGITVKGLQKIRANRGLI